MTGDDQLLVSAQNALKFIAAAKHPEHGGWRYAPRQQSDLPRNSYCWYNATKLMFHMQGEHWDKWQTSLYPLLIASQEDDGPLRGSWDPYNLVPDRWGYYAGRVYFTAMNLLSLEIYHRHLPLLDTGLAVSAKK